MSLKSGCVLSDIEHNTTMSQLRSIEEEKVLKGFGSRLRTLRLLQGYTQEELAAKAGFSRSYYTEIETGKRNISLLNLHRLAQHLQISLKELFDFE